MSLLLIGAATVVMAAAAGYVAARRHQSELPPPNAVARRRDPSDPDPDEDDTPASDPFEALPLRLGDVVQVDREERWLAGAVLARDRREVVAAIFLAPEGAEQHAVAAFAPPRRDIYWLRPAQADAPAEPPATLEIGGTAMQRRSRRPVALQRLGKGTPEVGDEGVLALYDAGPGRVAVVLGTAGRTFAWAGKPVDPGRYDRLGHGGDCP
ncbi:hypothetical protein [Chondromyces crocatus]|uniref:DUF4178 domain-containing protein n=1 Tax=Chondromyces crocatus TaxID=52 RepID=A0A0K1EF13_CHOCO|nr:hypothetical protein [Chondromyces crocatus]AKT39282.1 uncharacterized protein CMC5_034300 [Chondromyces crocatus]